MIRHLLVCLLVWPVQAVLLGIGLCLTITSTALTVVAAFLLRTSNRLEPLTERNQYGRL